MGGGGATLRARILAAWLVPGLVLGALALAGCEDVGLQPWDGGPDAADATDEPDLQDDGADDGAPGEEGQEADGPPACDPGAPALEELGELAQGEARAGVPLAACAEHRYTLVAARGQTLELALAPDAALGRARLVVTYPDDPDWSAGLAQVSALDPGQPARLRLSPPRSGELVLLVRPFPGHGPGSYDLGLICLDGCDLETTRFPLVLVHGWTGWSNLGPYTYFYGVEELLTGRGYPVFVASLDPYNSVEVRSAQLAAQVEGFLAEGRARRLSLVAHSQGGLDSRRVASALGYADRVAAIFTISTPHHGTPLCDVALGYLPGPAQDILTFLLEWLGATAVGAESDAMASFEAMTTARVEEVFNPENPDDPRVLYRSWAGHTCSLGLSCGDMCDVEIQLAYDLLWAMGHTNDGIVPVDSAVWGEYQGEIPADHFDEVGQLLGMTGPNPDGPDFDHLEFYLGLARQLRDAGL